MSTFSLRASIISITIVMLAGSFFAVLIAEENKRLARNVADRELFLEEIKNTNQSRQVYLDAIMKNKEAALKNMEAAKQQYEDLVAKQPSIIQDNQQQKTVVVQEQVPVKTTVPAAKPKSTRSTKTS